MRAYLTTVFLLLLGLISSAWAFQSEGKLKSGPQPGEFLPGPFHFLNINGTHAGSPHCLVCEYGLKPVVLVFAREIPAENGQLMNLLKKLDETVADHQKAELRSFAVILNKDYNDEAARKKLVQELEGKATGFKQLVISIGGPDGPENYNLDKDADVTVLLYSKHKVTANFAFAKEKLTEKDVSAILAAVTKMVPKS